MVLQSLFRKKKTRGAPINTKQEEVSEETNISNDDMKAKGSMSERLLKGIDNTEQTVNILKDVSIQLDTMSEEIYGAIEQISDGALNEDKDVLKCSELTHELSKKINEVSDLLEKMSFTVGITQNSTVESNKRMNELRKNNGNFKNYFDIIGEKVDELNLRAGEIKEITKAISAITGQTSMLSLNASIEAARAGDAGRGFAVVAEEVRKLATQSRTFTEDIGKLTKTISKNISDTFQIVNEAKKVFEKQEVSVAQTQQSFDGIQADMNNMQNSMEIIYTKISEIDQSREKVVSSIESISAVVTQSVAATEEIVASIEEQKAITKEMVEITNNTAAHIAELKKFLNRDDKE